MKFNTKRTVTLALLVSVAMLLSYIESLVPAFVAVPGVKLGLSNVATVFALYTLGWPAAIAVSVVRVFLSALLFGNVPALLYSLSGAALALTAMIILKKLTPLSHVGVSVAGAISHNAGQIIAVSIVMENAAIAYYIVPLILTGTVAGVVIGIASGLLIRRLERHI